MDDNQDKERWAIREVFKTLHKVGVSVDSAQEAHDAIDLAARILSYCLKREVTVEELKDEMKAMMVDDIAAGIVEAHWVH